MKNKTNSIILLGIAILMIIGIFNLFVSSGIEECSLVLPAGTYINMEEVLFDSEETNQIMKNALCEKDVYSQEFVDELLGMIGKLEYEKEWFCEDHDCYCEPMMNGRECHYFFVD